MNKLTLTDTTVKCFKVEFKGNCSMKKLQQAVRILTSYQNIKTIKENDWIELEKNIWKETNQDDVRIFLYLKTITNCHVCESFYFSKFYFFHLIRIS